MGIKECNCCHEHRVTYGIAESPIVHLKLALHCMLTILKYKIKKIRRGRISHIFDVPLQIEFIKADILKMTVQRRKAVQFEQGILWLTDFPPQAHKHTSMSC